MRIRTGWQNITIQATHGFTAATGSNNVLDDVVAMAGNSSAEASHRRDWCWIWTGIAAGMDGEECGGYAILERGAAPTCRDDCGRGCDGSDCWSRAWIGIRPVWSAGSSEIQRELHSGCTADVNSDGSIGAVSVTQGGSGCSGTTTASVNVAGTWDAAAAVNLIGGQSMMFFGGNLLKGNGGYTVWNAAGSESYGTQLNGGGGTLPGGGTYAAWATATWEPLFK